MVVAEADLQVAQPARGKAPLLAQDARQLPLVNMARLLLHGLSVRIIVAGTPGEPAGALAQAPCICCMCRIIAASTSCGWSLGLNWMNSVPASAAGAWPGDR